MKDIQKIQISLLASHAALLVQVYQQGVELRQRTKVGLGLRGLG